MNLQELRLNNSYFCAFIDKNINVYEANSNG
jgi:hypothetical protein